MSHESYQFSFLAQLKSSRYPDNLLLLFFFVNHHDKY